MKIEHDNAELSLTPTDTVLVPACIENFELHGDGEVYMCCCCPKVWSMSIHTKTFQLFNTSYSLQQTLYRGGVYDYIEHNGD